MPKRHHSLLCSALEVFEMIMFSVQKLLVIFYNETYFGRGKSRETAKTIGLILAEIQDSNSRTVYPISFHSRISLPCLIVNLINRYPKRLITAARVLVGPTPIAWTRGRTVLEVSAEKARRHVKATAVASALLE